MRGGTTVNVVGGSVTHANGTAIYFPSEKGTLNISGGVVSGKVAVEVRGGTVNVSGGKLVASGEYKASKPRRKVAFMKAVWLSALLKCKTVKFRQAFPTAVFLRKRVARRCK